MLYLDGDGRGGRTHGASLCGRRHYKWTVFSQTLLERGEICFFCGHVISRNDCPFLYDPATRSEAKSAPKTRLSSARSTLVQLLQEEQEEEDKEQHERDGAGKK